MAVHRPAAPAAGSAGEARGSVQARVPALRPRPRHAAAEAAALQNVGNLAYRLGDRIALIDEPPRGLFDTPFQAVSVDIGPSLKLFGGVEAALRRARELAAGPLAHHDTRLGLAPTLAAAAVCARNELAPIADRADLRERLSPLPLGALRWPEATQELLLGSGHETLGDVLRHDPASLAARLGSGFPAVLDRLLGRQPDPRDWFVPPPRYRRRFDMEAEIDDWQALLFPLKRLFDEFEAYLRARQVAVTQLNLTLARRRTETEGFTLRTTAPTQDAGVFMRLLRERWNNRPPQAAASELRLHADRFLDLHSPQTPLFDDGQAAGEAWNDLVDRLRARLGDEAVWRPGLVADHRPERAWSRGGSSKTPAALPRRPLWLLRDPRPYESGVSAGPAERIVGGWWEGMPIERDYRFVDGPGGETLWVYRDGADGRWFVHGTGG
jgi:protein ImuB